MKTTIDFLEQLLEGKINADERMFLESLDYIYPDSINKKDDSVLFLAKKMSTKFLIILGKSILFDKFEGELILGNHGKVCPLNHINSQYLREYFPFTSPVSHKRHPVTVGLGDRLGLASPGHLRLTKKYKFFPILAQQSIRELNLTGRTYKDVLDSVSWAVFQEGYRNGFGADGDHLKTEEEVQMALDCGFTMITLDCSDHINNSIYEMTKSQIEEQYLLIAEATRKDLEQKYMNKMFAVNENFKIFFNDIDFKKIVLVYLDTIEYTAHIYQKFLSPLNDRIDFEMSIDETLFATSIEAHYFVASELIDRGVKITSLAPKFYGEFQKGINYIGDKKQFEEEFALHFFISEHFGYKLSIHSGSDKFSVFPIVGRITKEYFHLKTAGTNWLEAIRVIAQKDPLLFRQIYDFGAKHLEDAKKYYHIKTDVGDIISLEKISDISLPNLLNDDNVRQILHITYGLILQAEGEDDQYLFKDKIFSLLNTFEQEYYQGLYGHIGKHLEKLNVEKIDVKK